MLFTKIKFFISEQKIFLIAIISLTSIIFVKFSFALSQPTENVFIDSKVFEKLKTEREVRVIVNLKNTVINYNKVTENNSDISLKEITRRMYELQDNVLPTLSLSEFRIRHRFELMPSFSGYVTIEGLNKLKNNPHVESIYLVSDIYASLPESATLINSHEVWKTKINNVNITGNVTVCVIDSGINYTHPNLGSCNITNNINDGSCNKVIGGLSYCANEQCSQNNNNPIDNNGHGTHIAGIVASTDTMVRGVSPGVRLFAMKVLNSTGDGFTDDLADAIEKCRLNRTANNLYIITISINFGAENFSNACTDDGSGVINQINNALNEGIFVSVSSGNDGNLSGIKRPACASGATSVGATYDGNLGRQPPSGVWSKAKCFDANVKTDMITCFSNRANISDLLAPGSVINSTNHLTLYENISGTSQAAPHVAGVAALMKQANNSLLPSEIESIMKRTGKPVYDHATGLTFPRIDAYRSVMASIYDVFVNDLAVLNSTTDGKHIFEFSTFNDLNSTINVSWNLSTGDGVVINGTQNISLGPYNESLVYVEHLYKNPGTYTVNASIISTQGTVNSQAITISMDTYNLRTKNLSVLNSTGNKRIFEFWIENNGTLSLTSVFWKLNTTGESEVNSVIPATMAKNETAFVYVEYQYANAGAHNVTVMTDPTNIHLELNETDNVITITD